MRVRQKGLIQTLQTAQNDGLCKITGVFCTMPVDPLHNLTSVPPISYVMPKLMHAYANRLQAMNLVARVWTVLHQDQCQYWPEYVRPPINLSHTSVGVGPSTYRAVDPCTARWWTHTCLTYIHDPSAYAIMHHKAQLKGAFPNSFPLDHHLLVAGSPTSSCFVGYIPQ